MFRIVNILKHVLPVIIILITIGVSNLWSQTDPDNSESAYQIPEVVINTFNLFEKSDILELSLRFDITAYKENKPEEEYLDALLTYKYNGQDSINKKIRLRARGNYRYRNCEFPPLRFNFKDASFGFADLDSLNNVKMVTHCFDNDTYQTYLMREYLIYRLYNVVTDYSFRVRFLKVKYIDVGEEGHVFEQYGFLIEPLDRLLFRVNATEVEKERLIFEDVEPALMDRISVFQYLIGNCDWFVEIVHNFKLIKHFGSDSTKVIPIPYDFDFSGFVNTHYAVARSDLNLEKITDRAYMGPCRSKEEFMKMLDEFEGYEDLFLDEVRNFKYLDRRVRKELIAYIKSFYDLYKKDKILDNLMRECVE